MIDTSKRKRTLVIPAENLVTRTKVEKLQLRPAESPEIQQQTGFRPFFNRGGVVTNEQINRSRNEVGD